ncbi:MAG: hypothetical protein FVQ85_05860 [Planctomycetes bacterium]|nr:hypothetical protein [Planctomycetota bacterium]
MNVTKVSTTDYVNKTLGQHGKNEPKTNPIKANLINARMNVNKELTKDYEKMSNWAICENEPNQSQSEILNPKSQIYSHPTANKLHTPRRQSWGCFDLIGRATPITIGLSFSLADLKYYCPIADKNTRALTSYFLN